MIPSAPATSLKGRRGAGCARDRVKGGEGRSIAEAGPVWGLGTEGPEASESEASGDEGESGG